MAQRRLTNQYWWQPGLEAFLLQHKALWETTLELGKRRRIVEFGISVGKISGRVQDESGRMFRSEFLIPVLPETAWQTVILQLSEECLALGMFLSGVLPREVSEVIAEHGGSLIPLTETLKHRCECPDGREWCTHKLSLWERFRERVDEDPFTLLTLQGKSRDECIASLRQQRVLRQKANEQPGLSMHQLSLSETTYDAYWKVDPRLTHLSYNIRADELPAALLKRLEPVPIDELATDCDRNLEEAYEQVARRAQAFGLGMIRSARSERL